MDGAVELLKVLQAQHALFTSPGSSVQVKLARLQASVRFFHALSDGWAANEDEPTRNNFMLLLF